MKKKIIKDLFCFQCDLQFDKKSIYDMHLSIVHNYRHRTVIEIKSEPEEMELPIESGIIPSKVTEDQDLSINSLKQNIVNQKKEKINTATLLSNSFCEGRCAH